MDALTAILLTALAFDPQEDAAREVVDLIEVNHFYDEQGKHVFDQIIFYDWSWSESRYDVRDWRLLKSNDQIPLRNWQQGGFASVWHDGVILRDVQARSVKETWTQYDPELLQRQQLPKEQRRRLHRPILPASCCSEQ